MTQENLDLIEELRKEIAQLKKELEEERGRVYDLQLELIRIDNHLIQEELDRLNREAEEKSGG